MSSTGRMRKGAGMRAMFAVTAFLTLSAVAAAQQLQPLAPVPDFDKVAIKTTNLSNQIYVLEGEGGNGCGCR